MKSSRLVKPAGYLITAACVVLVGLKIYGSRSGLGADLNWPRTLGLVSAGSGIFAVNCLWLALAWAVAVNSLGEPKIRFKNTLAVYGRSWLAKYLPGNVFHFAGRHILGRSVGLDHARLAAGLIYEASGQIAVAGLLVLWGTAAYGLRSAAPLPAPSASPDRSRPPALAGVEKAGPPPQNLPPAGPGTGGLPDPQLRAVAGSAFLRGLLPGLRRDGLAGPGGSDRADPGSLPGLCDLSFFPELDPGLHHPRGPGRAGDPGGGSGLRTESFDRRGRSLEHGPPPAADDHGGRSFVPLPVPLCGPERA